MMSDIFKRLPLDIVKKILDYDDRSEIILTGKIPKNDYRYEIIESVSKTNRYCIDENINVTILLLEITPYKYIYFEYDEFTGVKRYSHDRWEDNVGSIIKGYYTYV